MESVLASLAWFFWETTVHHAYNPREKKHKPNKEKSTEYHINSRVAYRTFNLSLEV